MQVFGEHGVDDAADDFVLAEQELCDAPVEAGVVLQQAERALAVIEVTPQWSAVLRAVGRRRRPGAHRSSASVGMG
ncbi:hypothetical protein ABZ388_27795 [Micromonospora parva]|uniref:hypothetical protein n=1 Tax=Micromonospora parva TaxID=1464048 RepID=UPI0033C35469